jgi:hypothetical protein
MSMPAASQFEALLAQLPSEPGAELILRADGERATATLRPIAGPPRVFVRESGLLVELCAAADEQLPGHRLLAEPQLLATALASQLGTVANVRLVAWRPGRRAVLRIVLGSGRVVWCKLLDRKSWRRAMRAFAAMRVALAPLHLCLPELLLEDYCAYLAPNAPGDSLRALLAEGRLPPVTHIARGLMALAYTHGDDELPVLDFAAVRKATTAMLQKGAAQHGDLHELAAKVATLPDIEGNRATAFVHGDLHDKQIFVDDDRISLIDLEGVSIGDARFDLANLAEHIRLRDLQQTGRDQGFADVLLARCGMTPDAHATRAFRCMVRARLCGVYALRPRWTTLVTQLRSESLTLLDELL